LSSNRVSSAARTAGWSSTMSTFSMIAFPS
jgi:hypothetical protein